MKTILTAMIFTLSLTAVMFAQGLTKAGTGTMEAKSDKKPRIAVIEFTADNHVPAHAQSMNNLKQIALGVVDKTKKERRDIWIEVPSIPLGAQELYRSYLGRPIDPVGAVKIGKLLGVEYVMTGHVRIFNGTKVGLETQMVKVSSGAIVWNGPVILAGDYNSDGTVTSADYTPARNGNLQITQFAVDPAVQKLTASLKAADL